MSGSIIPTLRYRDAHAAIEFFQRALGFELVMLVEGQDGVVEHSQLKHGSGMVMVSNVRDNEWQKIVDDGRDPTGRGVNYVVVADPYAHAEHARSSGAEIVAEPEEQDYGGAVYTLRDPEGNIWSFGSYDPWAD
ncbi:MAG: VOC family protein [Acidimicrobiia bacterium]